MKIDQSRIVGRILLFVGLLLTCVLSAFIVNHTTYDSLSADNVISNTTGHLPNGNILHTYTDYNLNLWFLFIPLYVLIAEGLYFGFYVKDNCFDSSDKFCSMSLAVVIEGALLGIGFLAGQIFYIVLGILIVAVPVLVYIFFESNKYIVEHLTSDGEPENKVSNNVEVKK